MPIEQALVQWVVVGPAGQRSLLAPEEPPPRVPGGPEQPLASPAVLSSSWLVRPLRLVGPADRATALPEGEELDLRVRLRAAPGGAAPFLAVHKDLGEVERVAAIDELLVCWLAMAEELGFSPVSGGMDDDDAIQVRLKVGPVAAAHALDRLLLWRAGSAMAAHARGLWVHDAWRQIGAEAVRLGPGPGRG